MGKIYTKKGDKGETSLMGGFRVPKFHVRVEAYGTIDEACSFIGIIISNIQYPISNIQYQLVEVQRDLFQIEALLSEPAATQFPQFIAALEKRIPVLEEEIDTMTAQMPELKNFILPGGSVAGAQLQFARTLIRRAERRVAELGSKEEVHSVIVQYLNRLSDYLFTLSRFVNFLSKQKETTWSR